MHESLLVKWLRWLIYGSTLIPLVIFSQYVSPFHFGKVVVLRSIVEIMVGLYLLLIWRDRSYLPKSSPILWAFTAFTAAFTITSIFSIAPLQSFWGTLERMGGLFTFWHYFAFYLIANAILRTRRDWYVLIDLMIASGVLSALYGFLQRFSISIILGSGGRERIFGTIGNPALFAGYQILIAYLALTFAFLRRATEIPERGLERGIKAIGIGVGLAILIGLLANSWVWLEGLWIVPLGYSMYGVMLCGAVFARGMRWLYAAAAGLTFLAVIMTAVRGSLLAIIIASILFVLLWSIVNRSTKARRILLLSIAGVVVFVFLAIGLRNTSFVQNSSYLKRVTDFSAQTTTVQTRFWAWTAGLKGFVDTPKTVVLGWGPENFNVPFSKYFNPKFFTGPGSETFFDRAHNMFIEVLVTMGLLGELTYLALFAMLFWVLARMMQKSGDERVIGIGFIALTVAYIIHNAFIFDTSANFITFFILLAFITYASREEIKLVPTKISRWTGLQKGAAAILVLISIPVLYGFNVRPALANFATTRAIVAGWQGDWTTAVEDYRLAINYDAPGRYESRHRFAYYILEVSGLSDSNKKISDFKSVALEVVSDLNDNIKENPQDYLPYLYASRIYIALGKADPASPYNDLALQYSKKALTISPTFVRTFYEVAQAYLNKHDYATAFDWFKKAADLNSAVGLTYWYMGITRYQGAALKNDLAGEREGIGYLTMAVQKGYTLSESDSQKIIAGYVQFGDIQGTVPILEQLVKNNPTNAQYWGSLATAYARVGRNQDALSAARKVLELSANDPELKAQAEAFIRSLGGTP